jgi:hypothetical protein
VSDGTRTRDRLDHTQELSSSRGRLVSAEAMPSDQLLTAEEVARLLQVRTRGCTTLPAAARYLTCGSVDTSGFGVTQSMLGFVSLSADPPAAPEPPAGPDTGVGQPLASESTTLDV